MDHNIELAKYIADHPKTGVNVRGFFRVQLEEPGGLGIAGDSGWQENQITNLGFRNLVYLLGNITGSSQITHLALGTGGVPASDATSLGGELDVRASVTTAVSGSTALQLTATFASAASFVGGASNISNIGCFCTSDTAGGTLLAGNTYASSSCDTNQNVNATYTWTFS